MTKTSAIDFDPERVESPLKRAESLKHHRRQCPVARSASHGGFWLVSRYADVQRVLLDPAGFPSGKYVEPDTGSVVGGTVIPATPIKRFIPSETDGAEWRRYRGVLNDHFRPEIVETRRLAVEAQTAALLDRVISTGRIDFVLDLGNPLSAIATMSIMGFPLGNYERWARPFHEVVYSPTRSPEMAHAAAELEWVYDQIRSAIAERRQLAGDDLLSALMRADPAGGPLSDEEILELSVQVLGGAIETTTALTASALAHLGEEPQLRERLRTDRALLDQAFDEYLRFFAPVQNLARTVATGTTISGQPVGEGDRILLSFASANRDEAVFERPDEVDIDRHPNRHLGMGIGRHFCLGTHQARMMFKVMMNAVLDRLPHYAILPDESARYPSIGNVNGWINLAASF